MDQSFCAQGTLLDYSFSKGHLAYWAGPTALQNTLLLHDDADSVTFFFEGSDTTEAIHLKLEHPQLDPEDFEPIPLFIRSREGKGDPGAGEGAKAVAGEHQLNLPAGPLYSRITVEVANNVCFAMRCMALATTKYIFHVVRVGEALSLNLLGQVDVPAGTVAFQEHRRWLYQQRNADWYVPTLKEGGNITLEVVLRPVCFAPLHPSVGACRSHLVQYSDTCHCGEESVRGAWFGSECSKEQKVVLRNASLCVFVRECEFEEGSESWDELRATGSKASLAGKDVVNWLQDVNVSGKFARLILSDLPYDSSSEAKPAIAAGSKDGHSNVQVLTMKKTSEFQIRNVFVVSMPADILLTRELQLAVSTTQEETDAEEQALPLRVVPHAPPLKLINDTGLLLPHFAMDAKRSEYAACLLSDLKHMHAEAFDKRFRVQEQTVELARDCFDLPVMQKRFRALRSDPCQDCGEYQAWADNYDVAVTLSTQACLDEALNLGEATIFKRIAHTLPCGRVKTHQARCGLLQRAVRLDRWQLITELPTCWDRECTNCTETPLAVAASENKLDALTSLLDSRQVDVDVMDARNVNALWHAIQHCHIGAVKLLIQKGSNVNHLVSDGCSAYLGRLNMDCHSGCRLIKL